MVVFMDLLARMEQEKQLFFNLISGFVRLDKGEILLNNFKLKTLPEYRISRLGISRTFQKNRLILSLSVLDNVLLILNKANEKPFKILKAKFLGKNSDDKNTTLAKELLKEFGLLKISSNLANNISYGQQKLLSICCCIAKDSIVFLFDEPFAGLDFEYKIIVERLFRKLKHQNKLIIIIEHDINLLRKLADEYVFINKGKLVKYSSFYKLSKTSYFRHLWEQY